MVLGIARAFGQHTTAGLKYPGSFTARSVTLLLKCHFGKCVSQRGMTVCGPRGCEPASARPAPPAWHSLVTAWRVGFCCQKGRRELP